MTLDSRLKNTFSEVFGIAPESVNDGSSVQNVEQWDSMNGMVLAMALEEQFQVQFTDRELMAMSSYRIIRETLASKGVV